MIKIMLVSAISALLLFSGCSKESPKPKEIVSGECIVEGIEAPNWVCGNDTTNNSAVYRDVGISSLSQGGFGFSKREALANARSNLAQQIKTDVKDKVESFIRSTGIGKDETVDKVVTSVSKQVARVTMNGSKQIGFWQTPKNIYVLVQLPKANVGDKVVNAVSSSFKNDKALWQQFKSKQALENLEKEFQ